MTIVDGSRSQSLWNYGKTPNRFDLGFRKFRSEYRAKRRASRRRFRRLAGRFDRLIERVDGTIKKVEAAYYEFILTQEEEIASQIVYREPETVECV